MGWINSFLARARKDSLKHEPSRATLGQSKRGRMLATRFRPRQAAKQVQAVDFQRPGRNSAREYGRLLANGRRKQLCSVSGLEVIEGASCWSSFGSRISC